MIIHHLTCIGQHSGRRIWELAGDVGPGNSTWDLQYYKGGLGSIQHVDPEDYILVYPYSFALSYAFANTRVYT